MFEKSPLVPLLGRKERRPFSQLYEDEGLDRRGQSRKRLVVAARECGGIPGEPGIELRGELHHFQNASSGSGRPSHSGILNPSTRATVGATSLVRIGRFVPVPAGTPAPTATSQTRRHDSSPLRWFANPFPATSPSLPSSGTTNSVVRSRYCGKDCAWFHSSYTRRSVRRIASR